MAKKKKFETALKDLETIVKEMESGALSLEETLKKYEDGIKQSEFCLDILDKTEKKISILKKDQRGQLKREPYENE